MASESCVICFGELGPGEAFGFPCCWEAGCRAYMHADCAARLHCVGGAATRCPLCRQPVGAASLLDHRIASDCGQLHRKLSAEIKELKKAQEDLQEANAAGARKLALQDQSIKRLQETNVHLSKSTLSSRELMDALRLIERMPLKKPRREGRA